ncbi:MAG: nucleotide exchange factor GrpE [Planctomycetota bacterium]
MGRKQDKQDKREAEAREAAAQEAAAEAIDDDGEVGAVVAELQEQVAELTARLSEAREQLARRQADFDNMRKRLRREAAVSGDRSVARFVAPMLVEMDNFEHALKAASPESFEDFATGVSMIRDNLLGIFGNAGIEPIPTEGVFDPSMHEVVAQIEQPGHPRGTIIEVVRAGYRLHDQIIRAAQVVVTRPPAAEEQPPAAPPAEPSDEQEDADA